MKSSASHTAIAAALCAALAGCASAPHITPPQVAATLNPPAGQQIYLEALANGVQIYECVATDYLPKQFFWSFRAPEAELIDRNGKQIGKHYAGPSWEALDGSIVTGEVKARDAGSGPTAIPWLLLAAKSSKGTGVLADARFIQRVQTVGGNAPADGCDASALKQTVRIPYSAVYYFYRNAQ